jgi:hypothetical protein
VCLLTYLNPYNLKNLFIKKNSEKDDKTPQKLCNLYLNTCTHIFLILLYCFEIWATCVDLHI